MSEEQTNLSLEERVKALEKQVTDLAQAMGKIYGELSGIAKLLQTMQNQPQAQAPQDSGQSGAAGALMALMPLLQQFIQHSSGGSKLEELLIQMALEALMDERKAVNSLISTIIESIGKATGKTLAENVSKVIAVTEE